MTTNTNAALRSAAESALEALEILNGIDTETESVTIHVSDEIAALRAALTAAAAVPAAGIAAAPKEEPVPAGEYPPLPASYVGGTLLSAEPGITGCKVVLRFSNTDEAEVWFGALATRRAAPVAQGDAWRGLLWQIAYALACTPCAADEVLPKVQAIAEDAARLDWLDKACAGAIRLDDRAGLVPRYAYWGATQEAQSARAAIDAARSKAKKGGAW